MAADAHEPLDPSGHIPMRTWLPSAVVLAVVGLTVMSQMYVVIPLGPRIAADVGGSAAGVLLTVPTFAVWCAVGFLVFGPLSDRVDRRWVIASGLLAIGGATFLLATSSSLAELHLWRAVQGFATGTFSPPAVAYLNWAAPPSARASSTAGMTTSYLLATVAGQLYADLVAPVAGWSRMLTMSGVVYLLAAVVVWRLPPEPRPAPTAGPWWSAYPVMVRLWRRPDLGPAFLAGLPLLMTIVALYAGLERAGVEGLFVLRSVAAPPMLVALFASRLVTRFGAATLFRTVTSTGAVASLAVPWAGQGWALSVLAAVVTTSVALAVPTLLSAVSARAADTAGAAIAVTTFLIILGASAGAPLAVAVVGRAGLFGLSLVLGGVLLVAGASMAISSRAQAGGDATSL